MKDSAAKSATSQIYKTLWASLKGEAVKNRLITESAKKDKKKVEIRTHYKKGA